MAEHAVGQRAFAEGDVIQLAAGKVGVVEAAFGEGCVSQDGVGEIQPDRAAALEGCAAEQAVRERQAAQIAARERAVHKIRALDPQIGKRAPLENTVRAFQIAAFQPVDRVVDKADAFDGHILDERALDGALQVSHGISPHTSVIGASHHEPAVHAQNLPRDERRLVAREKQHGARDLVGRADAAQRGLVGQRSERGLVQRGVHVGVDHAG